MVRCSSATMMNLSMAMTAFTACVAAGGVGRLTRGLVLGDGGGARSQRRRTPSLDPVTNCNGGVPLDGSHATQRAVDGAGNTASALRSFEGKSGHRLAVRS